jgi:hypothetical protein
MCHELDAIEARYQADIDAYNDPDGNAVRNKKLDMQDEINRHKRRCLACMIAPGAAEVGRRQLQARRQTTR